MTEVLPTVPMVTHPRCWLNLPLPRDIRRLIHRYLNQVDLLMIEAAYFADSPQWYCPYTYRSCNPRTCFEYPDGSTRHCKKCRRKHEIPDPDRHNPMPQCKWSELKCACARWNQGATLARAIAQYPQLHLVHPCGRDVFWCAMTGGSTEFIHEHVNTYEHGFAGMFQWGKLDAITSYCNTNTRVDTLRAMASYGAAINPGCYDTAVACGNTAVAAWCAEVAMVCWCGLPSLWPFTSCGNIHDRKPSYMGPYRTSRDHINDVRTTQKLLELGNMELLSHTFAQQQMITCGLGFLSDYWMANDPPVHWLEIVKWVAAHGFDIRHEQFARVYLVAAGYKKCGNEFVRRAALDLEAITYLINNTVHVSFEVRRLIVYSDISLFNLFKPLVGIPTDSIDAEVAAYGSPKFLAHYVFSTVTREIFSQLALREQYTIVQSLVAQMIIPPTGEVANASE